jgi:hypothetical protein
MQKRSILVSCLAMVVLGATPASALSRAYVSGLGANASGCGTRASPCRTFQYAHNLVSAKGEIIVLDAADYGAVTITKSISIVDDGVGTAGVQAGANANAITVATTSPADVVHLRGIEVDGLGVAANGVVFKGQGALDIVRCVIRRFAGSNADGAGHGILVQQRGASPISVSISDTIAADNKGIGIYFAQSSGGADVQGLVDRTTISRNWVGIDINAFGGNGRGVTLAVTDSVVDKNQIGVYLQGNPGYASATLRNTTVKHSSSIGMHVDFSGYVEISGSSFMKNAAPQVECANGGIIWTYGDNIMPWASCMSSVAKH